MLKNLIVPLYLLFFLLSSDSLKGKFVLLQGYTMGTFYEVNYYSKNPYLSQDSVHKNIKDILIKIDDSMSNYKEDSEISKFNNSYTTDEVPASTLLLYVLQKAYAVFILTSGSFDITISPLVQSWGFGPNHKNLINTSPSFDTIQKELKRTGMSNLVIKQNSIRKKIPDLTIDLGGIAKGYAVDLIGEMLETLSIEDYIANIGGELRMKGNNKDNTPWKIAIQDPFSKENKPFLIFAPLNKSVATSGTYLQYHDKEIGKLSHIISPKTGRPIDNGVISTTVVDSSCIIADALATAFSVLGPTKSLYIANENNIAFIMLCKTENGIEVYASKSFEKYLQQN